MGLDEIPDNFLNKVWPKNPGAVHNVEHVAAKANEGGTLIHTAAMGELIQAPKVYRFYRPAEMDKTDMLNKTAEWVGSPPVLAKLHKEILGPRKWKAVHENINKTNGYPYSETDLANIVRAAVAAVFHEVDKKSLAPDKAVVSLIKYLVMIAQAQQYTMNKSWQQITKQSLDQAVEDFDDLEEMQPAWNHCAHKLIADSCGSQPKSCRNYLKAYNLVP